MEQHFYEQIKFILAGIAKRVCDIRKCGIKYNFGGGSRWR